MEVLWFIALVAFLIYMIVHDRKAKKNNKSSSTILSKRWWTWGIIIILVIGLFVTLSIDADQHDKAYKAESHKIEKKKQKNTKKNNNKVKKSNKTVLTKKQPKKKSFKESMRDDDYKALKTDLHNKLPAKYDNQLVAKINVANPEIIEITIKNSAVKKYTSDELKITIKSLCDDVASIYNEHKPYPKHTSIADIDVVDQSGRGYARADTDGTFNYDAD